MVKYCPSYIFIKEFHFLYTYFVVRWRYFSDTICSKKYIVHVQRSVLYNVYNCRFKIYQTTKILKNVEISIDFSDVK